MTNGTDMTASITRLRLSDTVCPIQEAALSWWSARGGVAELDNPSYTELGPHLQLALDNDQAGAPTFFYVGDESLPAELLGDKFSSWYHAGGWWDDGGYAASVSDSYSEVSISGKPVLERITAPIQIPAYLHRHSTALLNYVRLCLPTRLENGQTTFTIVTTGTVTFSKLDVLRWFTRPRNGS